MRKYDLLKVKNTDFLAAYGATSRNQTLHF